LGVFLTQSEIDIERSLSMSTPSYRQEIEIVQRLFAQNPNLCIDIILATEERSQAINSLANTYSRLAMLVSKKDRSALIKEFEKAQEFLGAKNNYLVQSIQNFSSKENQRDFQPQLNTDAQR
ncbi:prephenate dehydrogenase dimerization domain-containing protein, partial [Nodularia sphaerocarpa]|nr:chorismate mutase [Nodularia sphaerocarpa CS-585A2]